MKYTPEELIPRALQIYEEMMSVFSNSATVRDTLTDALDKWEVHYKASFRREFPDDDPEMCKEAISYILDNFDRIAPLSDINGVPRKPEVSS